MFFPPGGLIHFKGKEDEISSVTKVHLKSYKIAYFFVLHCDQISKQIQANHTKEIVIS